MVVHSWRKARAMSDAASVGEAERIVQLFSTSVLAVLGQRKQILDTHPGLLVFVHSELKPAEFLFRASFSIFTASVY